MRIQFGTPTGKVSPSITSSTINKFQNDGTMEMLVDDASGSDPSSASVSPPSPAMPVLVDGSSDLKPSSNLSQFCSRSTSPGPLTASDLENHLSSPYQYSYNMPGGLFIERSPTPQACV